MKSFYNLLFLENAPALVGFSCLACFYMLARRVARFRFSQNFSTIHWPCFCFYIRLHFVRNYVNWGYFYIFWNFFSEYSSFLHEGWVFFRVKSLFLGNLLLGVLQWFSSLLCNHSKKTTFNAYGLSWNYKLCTAFYWNMSFTVECATAGFRKRES